MGPPVHPFDEVAARRSCAGARAAIRPGARARSRPTRGRRVTRRRTRGTAGRAARATRPAGPGPARTSGAARRWRWSRRPAGPPVRSTAADVLLVGVGEARPGVHRRPVHVQPVGVGGRDVGGGPPEGAGRRGHLAAQVGHPVGLLPVRPPGCSHCAFQSPARSAVVKWPARRRVPTSRRAPGLDGPPVGGVGGQRRPAVGDEGLPGRRHRAAVPDEPGVAGVGAPHHDAVGRLRGGRGPWPAASRRTSSRRGRSPPGRQAVDREPARAQRAAGRGAGASSVPATLGRAGRRSLEPVPRHGPAGGGAGGDAGRGGQEGAPAEAAHGDARPRRDDPHRVQAGVGVDERPATARRRPRPACPSACSTHRVPSPLPAAFATGRAPATV